MKIKEVSKYILESVKKIGIFKSILIFLLNTIKIFIPLVLAYLLKNIVDSISIKAEIKDFIVLLTIVFFLFFIEKLITILNEVFTFSTNLLFENKIRKNNIEKITRLKYEHLENPYTYHLFSSANSSTNIHPLNIVARASNFFLSFFLLLLYFVIIFLFNPYLMILPVVFIVFDVFIKRKTEKMMFESNYNRKIIDLQNRVNYFGSLSNPVYYFENYTYNTSKLFKNKLNENNKKMFREKSKFLKKFLLFEIIEKLIYILIIYSNYTFIAYNTFNNEISIGNFIFYNSIIVLIFSLSLQGVDDYTFISGHLRIREMFNNYHNLSERKKVYGTNFNLNKKHTITFKNVSFKYPGGNDFVLKNVSFEIKPDEIVGIIGQNGCGKTTIIKLLCGLYEVNSGEIFIDNILINNIDQDSLSNVVNVMQQQIIKLSMTIKDYVTNGREFSEGKFINSLKTSGFYEDFIKNGYVTTTILGKQFNESGIELSTGQWQKLYMSRVLYNKKSINILDEPTSSMDAKSEDNFFTKISNIFNNQNLIFVSHRLSIVHLCDKIIFFDNDVVVFDTHESLLKNNDNYRLSYNAQKEMYYNETKNGN